MSCVPRATVADTALSGGRLGVGSGWVLPGSGFRIPDSRLSPVHRHKVQWYCIIVGPR